MQVRLAESRDQVPIGRDAWNALAARNPTSTAFQTYEWFDTWWSAFGARHRLFLATVHDAGQVIGIVPLMLVRGPLGLRQLELIGMPNADYQDVILPERREAAVAALCRFLVGQRSRWDMMVLRNLPENSPTVREFRAAFGAAGLGVMDMERQPCPTVLLRGRESEATQLLKRYSLRRRLRKLEQRGPVKFRILDSETEIDEALPGFFEQHIQRWQRGDDPSPFTMQAYRDWYRALAHAARRAGWLHFSVLECGDRPVAFHFGFQFGRTLSWYKPSFDWEFHRESPGTVLISRLIESAITLGLDELDFSSGTESFKLRFSNAETININLRVFASPILFRVFLGGAHLRRAARTAWHRLRQLGPGDADGHA